MYREQSRPRVLVVEDDPGNAQLLREQLLVLGYSADCALDGNRAVTMVCTNEYRAILLDLNMPEYDGVEVLTTLRRRRLLLPVKVIIVTGDLSYSRQRELNREVIDAYLTKPVDLMSLSSTLARLLPGEAA